VKHVPHKLSPAERQLVVDAACETEYRDLNPYLIVTRLLECGRYLASVSTFYRVLRERKLLTHREESAPRTKRTPPPERIADGPNQVFTWDITYLKRTVAGLYFFLYLVLDLWDRSIVGWAVHERESSEHSEQLFRSMSIRYDFDGVYVHQDNGGATKGGTLPTLFYELGIVPSFSRPRVSDDNPFSESLFSTVKRSVGYPKTFDTIETARAWVARFVDWYNTEHRHSAIGFVTPHQRRHGLDHEIFARRNETLMQAYARNPSRFRNGPKLWEHQPNVVLNPADATKKFSKNLRHLS
jgi:putative transposase